LPDSQTGFREGRRKGRRKERLGTEGVEEEELPSVPDSDTGGWETGRASGL